MKEKEARELLKELFERHNVPWIPTLFHPKPITTKENIVTDLGGALTVKNIIMGTFHVMTDICWFEFYGLPSATTVRHEFRHYLEHLGVEYIRKKG
ncbi:unnamed protein product [marine sediment metagenome]|uniref:Uncharacterized protein n=1 Tax=marine sediment metagenome TaxID=412755 RepID=X1FZZ4_9ZZZZ